MKIIKIYSDKPFKNVEFNTNFNVILGDIYDKSKKDRDSHNLGKSSLIKVIDFLMLDTFDESHIFHKYKDKFDGYTFFIELLLNSGRYLQIKRSVDKPSKISFKESESKIKGFLTDLQFDKIDIPFKKAKVMLNEYLDFDIVPKWSYRKSISYFLRSQYDYKDVFQLDKFRGQHKDWKPFLFDLLGFDGGLLVEKYEKEEEIDELNSRINKLKQEFNINAEDADKLKGILQIKISEKESFEKNIDNFNFYNKDKKINEELVEQVDNNLSTLNTYRYNLTFEREKINNSLSEDTSDVSIEDIDKLFKEAKIFFPNDLKKDYKDLEDFNKKISIERKKYLKIRLSSLDEQLNKLNSELQVLEFEKSNLLMILTDKSSYDKFKIYQKNLAKAEADISILQNNIDNINKVNNLEVKIESIKDEISKLIGVIRKSILSGNDFYTQIRKYFYENIKFILNVPSIISIKLNKLGNVEFNSDIQDSKEAQITAEGQGTTYKKILCAAFDLSLLMTYNQNSFYRFVYHDGIWEGLDDRRKIYFLDLIRAISKMFNIQYILTTINSDIPRDENDVLINFSEDEIAMILNDKDDKGKLFEISF